MADLDPQLVARTLAAPPFHAVEGVINCRDIGQSTNQPDQPALIRPGLLFRSGELTRLSPRGAQQLTDLAIRTVFDLRGDAEIAKYASASPDVPGVAFVRLPVGQNDEYDPAILAARVASFASDEKAAFATLYSEILDSGAPAFETIFKHIRDNPGSPCLVHCTAGKDRTGLFAALVQLLVGAPDDKIIEDYYLTTIGLFPVLPLLVERFRKMQILADNWAGFEAMGSARKETMRATLAMIREKYGGAEGYLKQMTSLSDADISRIRENLAPPAQAQA